MKSMAINKIKNLKIFLTIFSFILYEYSICQNIFSSEECVFETQLEEQNIEFGINGFDCGNTNILGGPLSQNTEYYLPSNDQNSIYVRLNIVIIQRDDGSGNFNQTNIEHQYVLQNNVINRMNNLMGNFTQNYEEYPECGRIKFFDSKIRFIPKFFYIRDSYLWDYSDKTSVLPSGSNFYLNDLDDYINDLTKNERGINVYLVLHGPAYIDWVDNGNCQGFIDVVNGDAPKPYLWGNSASQLPTTGDLERSSRIVMLNLYTDYMVKKNCVADNPEFGSPSWEQVRNGWLLANHGNFLHEIGHSLSLDHNSCQGHYNYGDNIMNQHNLGRTHFNSTQLGKMFKALSLSNVRQFVTEESFNNTCLTISNEQKFDINTRIYSNIIIRNGGTLRLTCKLIMPPNSYIIVEDGGELIIEGGEILSANGLEWNGIRNEITGSTLFDIGTEFIASEEYDYFVSYSDDYSMGCPISQPLYFNENNFISELFTDNKSAGKEDNNPLDFFPNPATKEINIRVNDKSWLNSSIIILDNDKKIVLSSNIDNDLKLLNINHLSKGLYFVIVKNKNGKEKKVKIVKK